MASQKSIFMFVAYMGFLVSPVLSQGLIEGLYCGKEVCYDVLDVTRDATKGEITKAYRKLARKWHPDMHRGEEAKADAEGKFTKIAAAYEILRDEEGRKEYDYMLDNPEEMYAHYFNYYRRHMAPKVDIRIVLSVSITVISVIQYWSAWNNYNTALSYLVTVPKYRMRALDIAKSERLLQTDKKKLKGKTKQEIREEEENVLKQVIEEKMDIRGGYSKPSVLNILWIQLLLSPYFLVKYIIWYIRWIFFFTIMRREYGDEEKSHVMRKSMGLSQLQWDALEDYEREGFFGRELWKKENFKVWKAEQEEEMKAKLAQSSKYKAYRRYMKKGGPGQITFIDDE